MRGLRMSWLYPGAFWKHVFMTLSWKPVATVVLNRLRTPT